MALIRITWKLFKTFLKGIDSFGQPILLSYRGKTDYRTWFGGLLTIILIFSIAVFFYQAIVSLIRRENIKVAYSQVYENDPYKIVLSGDDGFRLAVGFTPNEINNWKRKHFELRATHRINRRLDNGTVEDISRNIELVPCKKEDFTDSYDLITNSQYEEFLCINKNETLILEGRFESESFMYFRFRVEKCKNTSTTLCAPYEETLNLIKNNKIYFNFYFSNKIINLQNYLNPITDYLESSVFFLLDPLKYFKQADIFLQDNKIIKDDDLYFYRTEESNEVTFESFREQVTDVNTDIFGTFFFRSSRYRGIYAANSEKLTFMLSRLGGLMSILYSVIEIVARSYNRKKLLVSLANLLYNFFLSNSETECPAESPQNKNFSKKSSLDMIDKGEGSILNNKRMKFKIMPKLLKKGKQDNFCGEQILKEIEDTGGGTDSCKTQEVGLVGQIQKHLKRFTKIRLNWWILGLSFNNKKKEISTERYRILEKALKRVERDVDIIQILRKGNEVDKIKDFLFNDDQRTLFEFFPKPLVALKDLRSESIKKMSLKKKPKNRKSNRKITNQYIKKLMNRRGMGEEKGLSYLELFRAYNNVNLEENQTDEKYQKLISFLGPSILTIFRRHQEMLKSKENHS